MPDVSTRFQFQPLGDQVRAARPLAQDIIAASLTIDESQSLMDRVIELLDDRDLDRMIDDNEDCEAVCVLDDRLHAAFAIGVALGLMLRPDAFADENASVVR